MNGNTLGYLMVLTILIILSQAGLCYFLYRLLRAQQEKEVQLRLLQWKLEGGKEMKMLRLQAYERLILYMERISPASLVPRTFQSDMLSQEFQLALISAIRSEYEHNLSQQMYISNQSWKLVTDAKDEIIKTISLIAAQCPPDTPSGDLARRILQAVVEVNLPLPTRTAMDALKEEVRQMLD